LFSVIIADDEYKLCQLIQNSIDWEALGFQVIALAQSGTDALHLISEHKPDVVITDIRMPGLTGIELIEQAQEVSPGTEFIIISGFKYFEYAHNAMKFNIEHYLLKPIEEDELISALQKIHEKLISRMDFISKQNLIKMELSQSRISLRRNFFSALLYDPSIFDRSSTDEIDQYYRLLFRDGAYKVLIIKCDEDLPPASFEQNVILLKKIMDGLPRFFDDADNVYEVVSDITSYDLTCVINYHPEIEPLLNKRIKDIFYQAFDCAATFPSASITIGMSNIAHSTHALPSAFQNAVMAIKNRVFLGTGKIVTYSAGTDKEKSEHAVSFIETLGKLESYIETNNHEKILELISTVQQKISEMPSFDLGDLDFVCEEIIRCFMQACADMGNTKQNQPKISDDLHMGVYHAKSIPDIFSFLSESMIRISGEIYEKRSVGTTKTITTAKRYIAEHYNEPVKLEDVACEVSFNPSYFSVLFKQETGKSFSDYLVCTRIKEAKRLLKETKTNIADVANMVGYSDTKHFAKLFKKEVGVTPSRYRSLY
jgi:two-component system response regulator YesN